MITSTDNSRVKHIGKLLEKSRYRKECGSFVTEGIRMFHEIPEEDLLGVYVSEKFEREHAAELANADYEVLSDAVFAKISKTVTPQGVLCEVRRRNIQVEELLDAQGPQLFLLLESIQDPGNLGTMMRTAEGAGISGVIVNKETVDLYNPKTIRSTMGSIFRVPFAVAEDLGAVADEIAKRGGLVAATDLQCDGDYDEIDYTGDCAFLIGNEGNGLTPAMKAHATIRVRIPMEGRLESLNAAVASALCMYEAKRQRKHVSSMGQNLEK